MPEEKEQLEDAQNGWKYRAIIDDIYSKLRATEKYSETDTMTIEDIRKMIRDIESEYFD